MIIPRDEMTAEIRRRLIGYDKWNSLHTFEIGYWRDGKLACDTLAVLDRGIRPPEYPRIVKDIAARRLDELADNLPDIFLLSIEGFGVVKPGDDASDEVKIQFDRDRLNRHFHRRPDAMEMVSVIATDIYGRLWLGHKRRATPDDLDLEFYRPGNYRIGGRLPKALLEISASVRSLASQFN